LGGSRPVGLGGDRELPNRTKDTSHIYCTGGSAKFPLTTFSKKKINSKKKLISKKNSEKIM
jgi:hypothetical protein